MVSTPALSIVTATYNRANVLRYTIESVLAQSFRDWEMIVVGDCCSDETEAVVRGFGDDRLRFVNLPVNAGEQSVPNNEGVRLARSSTIAFLNHDDLWTPDHLERGLALLNGSDAELVWALTVAVLPSGQTRLHGATKGGWGPQLFVPASSWIVRRSLIDAVGPWRSAHEIYAAPSQEWLLRAWKARRLMRSTGRATVLALFSGSRPGSYAQRQWEEAEAYATRLREEPGLMDRLLASAAIGRAEHDAALPLLRPLRTLAIHLGQRMLIAAGIHPESVRNAVLYRRRGGVINRLRQIRGLPSLKKGERT